MNRRDWGLANSGKRVKRCPVHGSFEGYPATKCPECKKAAPAPAQAILRGVLSIDGRERKVTVTVEG